MDLFRILNDPAVRNFSKEIIREGLKKDPVDAVADIELALKTLKEEFKCRGYLQ